jgi:DNA-binding MltR family transcriptional regulator
MEALEHEQRLRKANRTDWDYKLHSAVWAYQTSYKTSIRSTPFRMAFGLEVVMPSEFIVPSLRIQLQHKLNKSESEHAQVAQLLRLEEERIQSMEALEHEQRLRKANRTDWDHKLHSALWAYRTSYKTSFRSTPFRMAFGLGAVMPSEFIVPSLRIQLQHKLNKSESEHARAEQLFDRRQASKEE